MDIKGSTGPCKTLYWFCVMLDGVIVFVFCVMLDGVTVCVLCRVNQLCIDCGYFPLGTRRATAADRRWKVQRNRQINC